MTHTEAVKLIESLNEKDRAELKKIYDETFENAKDGAEPDGLDYECLQEKLKKQDLQLTSDHGYPKQIYIGISGDITGNEGGIWITRGQNVRQKIAEYIVSYGTSFEGWLENICENIESFDYIADIKDKKELKQFIGGQMQDEEWFNIECNARCTMCDNGSSAELEEHEYCCCSNCINCESSRK